jgi:PAS domain S-box-containing protein
MLGHANTDDLLGKSLYALIIPSLHEIVRAQLNDLSLGAGRSVPHGRLRMRKTDGEVIDVEATAASIEFDGRIFVQFELRDITRELRALEDLHVLNRTLEERVAERTADLTHANRDLESFTYSVAHDLRAPLRSMSGFAQILELDVGEGDFDKVRDHVKRIVDNAEKMNALIDGLLNVARCSRGELASERVDMQRLIGEVLAEQHARASARVTVGSLPAIRGDAASLRQVWVNLISNALKYSAKQAQPEIAIDCDIVESEAIFSVRDNGAGFDPAYASKLFGVFQRLHTAHEYEGTGVGLAVVRAIVERHGGRVWAEGVPGAGATFYFALPTEVLALA